MGGKCSCATCILCLLHLAPNAVYGRARIQSVHYKCDIETYYRGREGEGFAPIYKSATEAGLKMNWLERLLCGTRSLRDYNDVRAACGLPEYVM